MIRIIKQSIAWTMIVGILVSTILPIYPIVYAQNYTTSRLKCPDYKFTRTLSQNSRGEDVRLIQSILNLDYRTRVAPSGVGSKGYETDLYGVATREALKRFQALFIELIGIADGKFNDRTMTVMNAVCQGQYFRGGTGGVYDGLGSSTTTASTAQIDKVSPSITISAPSSNYTDEPFRLWIIANEPIQAFSLDKFIILGGGVISDLRKENPTTYKVLVTPGKLTNHTLSIQLEAESIKDLAGNLNQNASNELTLSLLQRPAGPDTTAPSAVFSSGSLGVMTIDASGTVPSVSATLSFSEPVNGSLSLSNFVVRGSIAVSDLKKLDNSTYSFMVTSSATSRATGSIQLPAGIVADSSGNKNIVSNEYQFNILPLPTIISTTTDQQTYSPGYTDTGSGASSQSDPMNMLMYLMMGSQALSGLTSLLGKNPFSGSTAATPQTSGNQAITDALAGGGKDFGGNLAPSGACVCPASPYKQTVVASSVSGAGAVPGIYALAVPGIPMGPYKGVAMPAPTICGSDVPVYIKGTPVCPRGGVPVGYCCNPLLDSTMKPVLGVLIKAN